LTDLSLTTKLKFAVQKSDQTPSFGPNAPIESEAQDVTPFSTSTSTPIDVQVKHANQPDIPSKMTLTTSSSYRVLIM
jgi:hypothetical protein